MEWLSVGKCHILRTQILGGNKHSTTNSSGIPGRKAKQRKQRKEGENPSIAKKKKKAGVLIMFTRGAPVIIAMQKGITGGAL